MDTQTPSKDAQPPAKRRIPPSIRKAISLYITTGMSKAEAAERSSITPGHLYNYLMRPHVKQFEEEKKGEFIQGIDAMRAPYKAQAFEVARDLMHNASSENVRMRAVEFLAGESKGMSINVGVQVNNQAPAKGYEYAHPNQEVVTIRQAEPRDITPKD